MAAEAATEGTGDSRGDRARAERRALWGAPLLVLAWLAGAALAGPLGPWVGIGGTAVVLGALGLALNPDRTGLGRGLWPIDPGMLALGVGSGLALAGVTYRLYPLVVAVWPWMARDTAGLYAAFNVVSPWMAVILLPVVVGAEEIVWRGLVHGLLERRMSLPAAVAIGAMIYAAAHLPAGSPVMAGAALGCGLIWTTLRAVSGGLLAPLVCHLVWDLMVLVVRPIVRG